jgi:uncharacterized protein YxjI
MKKFYLKQKVFAFTDRYKIYDENQKIVYHCEGAFFSFSHKMELLNTATQQLLFTLKRQIFAWLPTYHLTDGTGKEVATIKKRFTLFHHKLDIFSDFGDFIIDGDLFAHRFSITANGKIVVDFSKKWVSWGDSYEISIFPEEHVEFYLALVIMIDNCLHDSAHQHHSTINL